MKVFQELKIIAFWKSSCGVGVHEGYISYCVMQYQDVVAHAHPYLMSTDQQIRVQWKLFLAWSEIH